MSDSPTLDDRVRELPLAVRVDRACDAFEAAWRAGSPPRIEDVVRGIAPTEINAFLAELIAAERELRGLRGETPRDDEYNARFPGHDEAVNLAFSSVSRGRPSKRPLTSTILGENRDSGWIALLACELGLVNRDDLAEAILAWRADPGQSLAQVLVDQGRLAPADLERLSRRNANSRALKVGDGGDSTPSSDATAPWGEPRPDEVDRPVRISSIVEMAGTKIGPYKLVQKIGEGGMGTVFLAEQERPLRRTVALKVIKPGMDTEQVVARFEAERQALSMMDHPSIAKVLDAGATESGRPYFVMELVKGVPITEYCDTVQLTPEERLELFIPVCEAVQHAHQKGIIHRDIKPSNVLVAMQDGKPVPKVIDFGIAKAVDQKLTERSLFTQHGVIVGTLEYMSPEQAQMSAMDVDTRTDVYALGVLLYELLTGSSPLERSRLRGAAYSEILRRIREEEPPKPSTRLSESRDGLPSVAANRKVEPVRLTKLVRGELDWIVMKALEKDRTRRYETASGFARDIRRHLDGDAVEASPPSATYRLKKLARKHRVALTTAGVFALVLIAATIFSAWQMIVARQAESATKFALEETRKAKKVADGALTVSEEERRLSDAVANTLVESFRRSDPSKDGRDLKVVDLLDQATSKVEASLKGSPRIRGRMFHALGQTYIGLGLPERAEHVLRQARDVNEAALGPTHFDTLSAAGALANAILLGGRADDSIRMHEATVKLWDDRFGPNHPGTISERNGLAVALGSAGRRPEALEVLEETLARAKAAFGPEDPATFELRGNLAIAYVEVGRGAEGRALSEENLRLRAALGRDDDPKLMIARNNLASIDSLTGRAAVAIKTFEDLLKTRTVKLGADHPDTLTTRNNLAVAYGMAGRWTEAIDVLKVTVDLLATKSGIDHPSTLIARLNLTAAMQNADRWADSLPILVENLKLQTAKLGADHPQTLQGRSNLGAVLNALDRREEAIAELEAALKLAEPKLRPDHPVTYAIRTNLANYYGKSGRHSEAVSLLRVNLEQAREKLKPGDRKLADPINALASGLLKAKKWTEAEVLLREGLKLRHKAKPDDWATSATRSMLGEALIGRGKYEEAEPLVISGYEDLKAPKAKLSSANAEPLTDAADRVIKLYETWGKPEKAAEWRAKRDVKP